MASKKAYKDRYMELGAAEFTSGRENLPIAELENLPSTYLPAGEINEQAKFEYLGKELTKEQLDKAIAQQKEYYMPFLSDFAPKMETKRTHKELKTFDWRIGNDKDARNFQDVLKGKGNWEKVTIPHFGEPLGLATTYYRTEFELTKEEIEKESLWICFKGVDYEATVYVNDVLVGKHTGFFAPFEFDFTLQAREGKNTLLVVVDNDFIHKANSREYRGESYSGDKIYAATGVGYDEPLRGWHHCPPAMGIWQDVYIEGRSRLFIHDIFVRPVSYDKAELWLEIIGTKVDKTEVTFDISLYGQNFKHTVFENKHFVTDIGYHDPHIKNKPMKMERGLNYIKFDIDIPDAKIWETNEPWLYQIQLKMLDEDGAVLDERSRQFGMRLFTFDTDCSPKGMFYLNGKKIKFRGVNSQGREQRMVFLKDYDTLLRDYLLAKVGNINYLRITQRPVQPEVYDLCDRLGLLVQTDFPAFSCIRRNTVAEALKQAQEMEHLIRSHPSCVVSTYINEPAFCALSMPHRCLERHELELFFECADRVIHLLNPDRVIKPIDGDYDPPVPYGLPDYHCYTCWYNGHGIELGRLHKGYWMGIKGDWNYACGEFGMEGLDTVSLMKKYYPKEWLPKNDDDEWTPATIPGDPPPQLGHLHYNFYETPKTMAEWVEESQKFQALAMNFMTRAFRRNRRMISYAYHLFVDAYPNGWMKAMVDFEGTPKKAFWEFREAAAPVMVDIRTDRFKVWENEKINLEVRVCNDIDEEIKDVQLHYQVYLGEKLICASKTDAVISASDISFQGYLPVQLPSVSERTELKAQVALIRDNGEMLSSYELALEVFPKNSKDLGKVFAVGLSSEFEAVIKQQFNVSMVEKDQIDKNTAILVFDFDEYKKIENELTDVVKKGAKIIFFCLPVGTTEIAGDSIEVNNCSFRAMHFVSRNKEHAMVADFEPHDVRYWYDEDIDQLSPILYEIFTSEGYTPILTAAKRGVRTKENPTGTWIKAFAVAEKELGEGIVRVCQINLQNRIVSNPVANILFERLINM